MTPPTAMERERQPVKKRPPAPPCPKCQGNDTRVTNTLREIRRYRCSGCGHNWAGVRR